MNILITGGAGFIGSHVADFLLEKGHRVTIIDDLSTGRESNIPAGCDFVKMSISDPALADVFQKKQFDAVYHLAAQIDVRKSMQSPSDDVMLNVVGSLKLLEHCRNFNVRKFIFASSGGAIYGEQDYFPADENHIHHPLSIYGVDKLAVEHYMFAIHKDCGLDCVALRFANVYGPRQNHLGEAGVVAIFTNRMLKNQPATINGDGKQTRDYVYVHDVAEINRLSLNLEGFNVINVGTGVETDVNEIHKILSDKTGCQLPPNFGAAQPGEQQRSSLSCDHALKLLNWKPQMKLEDGLEQTVRWFQCL